MIELTEEERKHVEELSGYVKQTAGAVVEARLSAEVGPEEARNIIKQINELVDQGLKQEEIVEHLRKEGRPCGPVVMAGGIVFGGTVAYTQMP